MIDSSVVAELVVDKGKRSPILVAMHTNTNNNQEAAVNRGEVVKPSTKEEVNRLREFKSLLQFACRSGHSPTRELRSSQPSLECCVEWYEQRMKSWFNYNDYDKTNRMNLERLDFEKVKQALRMEI